MLIMMVLIVFVGHAVVEGETELGATLSEVIGADQAPLANEHESRVSSPSHDIIGEEVGSGLLLLFFLAHLQVASLFPLSMLHCPSFSPSASSGTRVLA